MMVSNVLKQLAGIKEIGPQDKHQSLRVAQGTVKRMRASAAAAMPAGAQ